MKSLFTPFPTPLSNRQWFYLLVLQGVGAGIIDGGANFAVAYAMYHGQKDIRMWVLAKNTIAGDLGVTPIIQCLASMLITSTLVHTDLHHNAVKPLAFVWPHVEHLPDPREIINRLGNSSKQKPKQNVIDKENQSSPSPSPSPEEKQIVQQGEKSMKGRKGGFVYYFKMLIRFIFEGTENSSITKIENSAALPLRILLTLAQGAAIGIIFGLPIFLIFIIVLGPIYKHDNLVSDDKWKWSPMVIKCIYGAVVGWITNPIIACLALGSQAEHHLIIISENQNQEQDLEQGQEARGGGGGGGVETIHEDEEFLPPPPIPDGGGSLRIPSIANGDSPRSVNRPRALSNLSTASSSRSGLGSRSKIRPPLITNCSNLPITSDLPLPPSSSSSLRRGSLSSLPKTPRSPGILQIGESNLLNIPSNSVNIERPSIQPLGSQSGRNRGATISSYISQTDSIASSNYSYALGGTGGRAKRQPNRPRAISSLSNTVRQPSFGPPNPNSPKIMLDNDNNDEERLKGSPMNRQFRSSSVGMHNITNTTMDSGSAGVAGAGEREVKTGSPTTTSNLTPPVWDVFGKIEESKSPIRSPSKELNRVEVTGKNDNKEGKEREI
ncbi:uncharacterized protein L201_004795 [Kwoniella dendrophila CBS 6074]|uniref:Uncharacterized protein n=1 Tax=Kwoniella dendrophila CBS 6074 TaxID=1295534 RepID=A0AAX4JWU5_9TREE